VGLALGCKLRLKGGRSCGSRRRRGLSARSLNSLRVGPRRSRASRNRVDQRRATCAAGVRRRRCPRNDRLTAPRRVSQAPPRRARRRGGGQRWWGCGRRGGRQRPHVLGLGRERRRRNSARERQRRSWAAARRACPARLNGSVCPRMVHLKGGGAGLRVRCARRAADVTGRPAGSQARLGEPHRGLFWPLCVALCPNRI